MEPKISKLAISALLLSILGLIIPVIALIGIVNGIAALYKIKHSNGAVKGKTVAIIGIVIGIFVIALSMIYYTNVRTHYRPFKIASSSMAPTIKSNERVIVDLIAYEANKPERGDIVIYELPDRDSKKKLVFKRIVGLPHEELEIRSGGIYINGLLTAIPGLPAGIIYLNGGDHGRAGKAVMIPDDSYYMLADNSISGVDSRYHGFIDIKNIKGKYLFTYTGMPVRRVIELLSKK